MTQAVTLDPGPRAAGWQQIGEQLVGCICGRDYTRLAQHFHPQVICRLLIPPGLITPLDVSTLVGKFQQWFGDADRLNLEGSQITSVGDRLHVGYRIRLREAGTWYTVEQQTYSHLEGDIITHFDLLCSGFRPDIEG